ncbi:hypothetical protein BGW37DRAFT_481274 [Umbelopsis sp. PMI_123]|jgi:GTPase Era involved in 16S rRNA processing|nr:hypothetical protein BGW37DRAFT_481274 [Umbelopsis sp. PMI_123]
MTILPGDADYAVFLCGNSGAGKSTLCNLLGAEFESGFSVGVGLTEKTQYAIVRLSNGDNICLIDAPGLYEANFENVKKNAKEIQQALGMNLAYKICFVLQDNSGRWRSEDVAMIDRVTESIATGSEIEYVLIINQIRARNWKEYQKPDVRAHLMEVLKNVTKKQIDIKKLCLCPLKDDIEENLETKRHIESCLEIVSAQVLGSINSLQVEENDLKLYQKILIGIGATLLSPIWAPLLGIAAAGSSIKNKISLDTWEPFI